MRVGAAYTQTGVLAKGWAKGSAGEIEELGRELGRELGLAVSLRLAHPRQRGGTPHFS